MHTLLVLSTLLLLVAGCILWAILLSSNRFLPSPELACRWKGGFDACSPQKPPPKRMPRPGCPCYLVAASCFASSCLVSSIS
jgi:hypothetical protein